MKSRPLSAVMSDHNEPSRQPEKPLWKTNPCELFLLGENLYCLLAFELRFFFVFVFFFKSEVIWLQDFQNNKVEGFLCSDTLDSPIRLVKLSKSGVLAQAKDTLKHALLFPYSSADWHSAKPGEKSHEELKVWVKTQTHSDGFLTFFFYMLTPD